MPRSVPEASKRQSELKFTSERRNAPGGGEVILEAGFAPEVVKALQARGHKVSVDNDGGFGGYQAIKRENGVYFGASESRKDGAAQGY